MRISDERYFVCPYCGSENSLTIDFSGGSRQEFTNDCETCCRPIVIRFEIDKDEIIYFETKKENE